MSNFIDPPEPELPRQYVIAQHEEDGLIFQLIVPEVWTLPVREGTIPSHMVAPQILITRA